MNLTPAAVVRWTVTAAAVLAYPVLAYYSTATVVTMSFPALSLTVVLMPVLAIVEHLVRLHKLPYLERHSIMSSLHAFNTTTKAGPDVSLHTR